MLDSTKQIQSKSHFVYTALVQKKAKQNVHSVYILLAGPERINRYLGLHTQCNYFEFTYLTLCKKRFYNINMVFKSILQRDSNTEQLRCHNLSRQKTGCSNKIIILQYRHKKKVKYAPLQTCILLFYLLTILSFWNLCSNHIFYISLYGTGTEYLCLFFKTISRTK